MINQGMNGERLNTNRVNNDINSLVESIYGLKTQLLCVCLCVCVYPELIGKNTSPRKLKICIQGNFVLRQRLIGF